VNEIVEFLVMAIGKLDEIGGFYSLNSQLSVVESEERRE